MSPGPGSGDELRHAGGEELERLVGRLERLAAQLRDGGIEPEAAAALIDECAQAAAQASSELERLTRAAAAEPAPGQDRLV